MTLYGTCTGNYWYTKEVLCFIFLLIGQVSPCFILNKKQWNNGTIEYRETFFAFIVTIQCVFRVSRKITMRQLTSQRLSSFLNGP